MRLLLTPPPRLLSTTPWLVGAPHPPVKRLLVPLVGPDLVRRSKPEFEALAMRCKRGFLVLFRRFNIKKKILPQKRGELKPSFLRCALRQSPTKKKTKNTVFHESCVPKASLQPAQKSRTGSPLNHDRLRTGSPPSGGEHPPVRGSSRSLRGP